MNTKQATHTPGPWELGLRLRKDRIYIHSSRNETDYGRAIVDVVNLDKELLDEDEANARLIAAAPEMLEAIERLQRWVGKYVADGMHNHELAKKDLDHSYDVITKVEGK